VKAHYNDIFWAKKCTRFVVHWIILGAIFFISFSVLRIIKNGFLTQVLQHNSCYLSNDNGFSKNSYVFTHLRLFEWKTSSRCGILHIKLKWYNELICNIWLSTSSNLLIVWMVFEIYLHFVVYWYNFIFFTNILFNHLIFNFKVGFFLQSFSLGFEILDLQKNVSILIW
jgi:hypothetical protein